MGRSETRSRQKVCCSNIQRIGESVDVVETNVPLTPFDASNVCAVHIGRVSQCLLTQSGLCPEVTQTLTEGSPPFGRDALF